MLVYTGRLYLVYFAIISNTHTHTHTHTHTKWVDERSVTNHSPLLCLSARMLHVKPSCGRGFWLQETTLLTSLAPPPPSPCSLSATLLSSSLGETSPAPNCFQNLPTPTCAATRITLNNLERKKLQMGLKCWSQN